MSNICSRFFKDGTVIAISSVAFSRNIIYNYQIYRRASLGTNITLTAEEIKLEQKNLDHIYTVSFM